jgi:hypothetical protein
MKATRAHEPTGISELVFDEAPDARPMFCDVTGPPTTLTTSGEAEVAG